MNGIEKNRIRFRRSFETLLRGIQQVYFRNSSFRDEILEIYGNHFYEHIEFIFEKLRNRLEKHIQEYSLNTMYNNILNVIVLFFILDYQKMYRNEKGIDAFIDKIFDIGFTFENGSGYFHLDLKYVIESIGFRYEQFENLQKLETPIVSILFSKNHSFQYRDLKFDSSMNEPSSPVSTTLSHQTESNQTYAQVTMSRVSQETTPVQMSVESSVEKQEIKTNTVQDGMVLGLVNIVQQYASRNEEMEKMFLQMKNRIETLETMNQSLMSMNTQLQNVNIQFQNVNGILQKEKNILENLVAEKNYEICQKNREIESLQQTNLLDSSQPDDFSPRSITNTGYQSPILDALLGKPFKF